MYLIRVDKPLRYQIMHLSYLFIQTQIVSSRLIANLRFKDRNPLLSYNSANLALGII